MAAKPKESSGSSGAGSKTGTSLEFAQPTCNTTQANALTLGCLCIFAMGGLVRGCGAQSWKA